MSEKMTLQELIKKRNELQLKLKLGKLRNAGELVKIRREIARRKTKSNGQRAMSNEQ